MPISRAILFQLATSAQFERATRVLPTGERLAWRSASRYVCGTAAADAFELARRLHEKGVAATIDQFGEQISDIAVADRVAADYLRLAGELTDLPEDAWLSIDLSHLGLDVDQSGCAERLAAIAGQLSAGRRIQVGAEDHGRSDAVLECVLTVAGQGLADRLGATVQANLRRAPADLERLIAADVHSGRCPLGDPGVIDQHVQATPRLPHRTQRLGDRLVAGHVRLQAARFTAGAGRGGSRGRLVDLETATRAPSAAKRSAIALPKSAPAPVTIARFPASRISSPKRQTAAGRLLPDRSTRAHK